ncbi:hypothetical protein [Brachyspira sp.]|uniref:tetratricopeptide repeat protein n=1 Tax=Brachyspira sp. TaxID=1977261 RepID=UPI002613583E|nr:hypothetical protein [Brachyspira sp.]
MKKEHNITTSIILSFLILSIFSMSIIILIYVLYTRGEGKNYSLITYVLYSLLIYKSYIPYIISLSVYFSFFRAKYLHQKSISKVIAVPIATIVVLVCFYTLYDYYFTDFFISTLREHSNARDTKVYYEYELQLKNKAYELAREELAVGNLDKAYSFAEEALFYDKNDGNTLLLIKTIQEEKKKIYDRKHKEEIDNINKLVSLGTREFSLSNYNKANKYFTDVLKLDNNNPLALYYINRISIARNEKPIYYGNTTKDISIYTRLSDTIKMYENGNLWNAYNSISKIYLEAHEIPEVNNYYSIIRDAVSRYDFFIKEAQEVKEAYLNNTDLLRYSFDFNHNGINLMLGKNVLLSSSSSAMFKNNLYIFDISLMELDDELKVVRCDNYLYGKLADVFKATNNMKNIILKAYFDTNKNEYNYNDSYSKVIPINISYSTINTIKNYSFLNFKYISFSDLFTLRKEITKFGYSDEEITMELLIKNIEPITYLLLFLIIAYYSFRFRLSMATEKFRFYNRVTGILGTLLFSLVYRVLINYIAILIILISHITIGVILIVILAAFFILFVIFQMARIPRDVR